MKFGDKVEVEQIWASQGALKPPLKKWAKGFEFVRIDSLNGAYAILKHVGGMYDGINVRYPVKDVRLEGSK